MRTIQDKLHSISVSFSSLFREEDRIKYGKWSFRILQVITVIRIPLAAVFFVFVHEPVFSLVILAIAYILDAIDGFVAKIFDVETRIGEALDHTSDWIVSVMTLVAFYRGHLVSQKIFIAAAIYFIIVGVGHSIFREEFRSNYVIHGFLRLSAYAYFLLIIIAFRILSLRVPEDLLWLELIIYLILLCTKGDRLYIYGKKILIAFIKSAPNGA